MQYATQLYTLRSLPPADRYRVVADAGFESVELVGFDTVSELAAHDLSVAGVHVDHETIAADPGDVVEQARAVGTETVVVPIAPTNWFDPAQVDETAARLDSLAQEVEEAGGQLLYHNHEFEFDGGAFERFVDATEHVGFELDVGWATAAGADPVALVDQLGDRLSVLHLKDVRIDGGARRGGVPVDLGEGDVDLTGVLEAAARTGVEWLVFEHDSPTDPARTVRAAAEWLGVEPSGPR